MGDGVAELGGEEQMRQLRVVRLRPRLFVRLPRSPVQREREMPMGELMTARALAVRLNLAFALAVGTLPSWLRRRACTTAHP